MFPLGKRKTDGDFVDLLVDCHARIRKFMGLARIAAEHPQLPGDERADVCNAVERYFREALPLHVRDEEETVAPRLEAAGSEVERALSAMHTEHREHEPMLAALLDASARLRVDPGSEACRAALLAAVSSFEADMEAHLVAEESIVFPAIRALPRAMQDEMLAELRNRRS